jgi:hypothetical protein
MPALVLAIFAAACAAVATAAFAVQALLLRRQLVRDEEVRSAALYQQLAGSFMQLDLIFLDRPHLRAYFYDDRTPTEPLHHAEAISLAEYVTDMAESCLALEKVLPELTGDWDEFLGRLCRSSPALREYLADSGHLFPPEVLRVFTGTPRRPKAPALRREENQPSAASSPESASAQSAPGDLHEQGTQLETATSELQPGES